jgi:hypothetical protein
VRNNEDKFEVAPAPGDVEETRAERAAARYTGKRSMTLQGGFSLASLRAGADDHEPFPLVRRRGT